VIALGLDELGSIDYRDMRRQFEINALGPLRVAEPCQPFLASGSKVGIVTSRVGSLGDNARRSGARADRTHGRTRSRFVGTVLCSPSTA